MSLNPSYIWSMSFDAPKPSIRGGPRYKVIAPVSTGVRIRGTAKKLTPFISLTEPVARGCFPELGDGGMPVIILIGKNQDSGRVRIKPGTAEHFHALLRRPAKGAKDWLIETLCIPFEGKKQVKKVGAAYFPVDGGGLDVVLPWRNSLVSL